MDIKVTVTTNEQNDDVMRFGLSEPIDISLTGTDGTKQLKELFSSLMHLLIEDEVCLSFIKTEGYGTKMYEDVCKEYLDVLNDELIAAREQAKAQGLAQ